MYKMLVESADWKELQDSLAVKDRIIDDLRKALTNLAKEFALCIGSTDPNESGAYKEAQKYL